jgi:hypothetical protein
MKKYYLFLSAIFFISMASAQTASTNTTSGTITGLEVPVSPAFSITDITPTLVQSPATPKAFALGVAQSFQQSGMGFPNNYSAEFAPVWWINPKGVNVYSYLGLPVPGKGQKTAVKEDIFSGIKFTTVSVAFINKDLIPDTSKSTQNIFSMGFHTTLIKVFGNKYAASLARSIDTWATDAHGELMDNRKVLDSIARLPQTDDTATHNKKVRDLLKNYRETQTPLDLAAINTLIEQKPIFAWDIAGALAVYSLNNNQQIKTGRAGVWTSLATYAPLNDDKTNYINVNVLGRYLLDNFQENAQGGVGTANNIDVGGNIGFEFDKLTVAVESLYRFINGVSNTENRTVGVITVKLTDKIFINGTFGKDFAGPNKLISAFGINWGFGKEQVSLP